jgi:hypothetical protein
MRNMSPRISPIPQVEDDAKPEPVITSRATAAATSGLTGQRNTAPTIGTDRVLVTRQVMAHRGYQVVILETGCSWAQRVPGAP